MFAADPLVGELLGLLKAHEVSDIVVSPGSRHYPITRSLESEKYFRLHSVVDERSAGFYALGVAQRTGGPVAVLCTSGTAALNYGSAMVEAYYQKLPLVALTTDRLPQLLNQMEDQMFAQTGVFEGFVRFMGQLHAGNSDSDRWHNNRVINEGLLATRYRGGGPVHLNIPIAGHSNIQFDRKSLPTVRVISRIGRDPKDAEAWSERRSALNGKKVLVIWGQGPRPSDEDLALVEGFVRSVGAVILGDHLSNLNSDLRIGNSFAFLGAMSQRDRRELSPDVVISFGGNFALMDGLRDFLRDGKFEHWRVNLDGEVVDPFRKLTTVFECANGEFLRAMRGAEGAGGYAERLQTIADGLELPPLKFGEMGLIGRFVAALPSGSNLHIANSAPMRMTQFWPMPSGVRVLGNRGVNGIDGCMSTAVGYSNVSSELNFLVIGDLTFFYDMNALWIRGVGSNLRILVINNEGGAVMHAPLPEAVGPSLGAHVSAQHSGSARGWVESLGFKYMSARSDDDFDRALQDLIEVSSDSPVVLEVFTNRLMDVSQYKAHRNSLKRHAGAQNLARRLSSGRLRLVRPWVKKIARVLGIRG